MTAAPFDLLAQVAQGERGRSSLRSFRLMARGRMLRLPAERWFHRPGPEDLEILSMASPPVLDAGCGPGRHSIELGRRGVQVLGVDVGPETVALARRRGARAMIASVFDALPLEGRWGTVLLLDGNLGIGGDPEALLRRVRALLRAGGRLLAEVSPRGATLRDRMWLEGDRGSSEPFPWAVVGAETLPGLAAATGFQLVSLWRRGNRWFARLDAA